MPKKFHLISEFQAAGDQPEAILALTKGLEENKKDQVLLGVTGSGKTFTMANIINQTQRPALIMAHNKTLAAQLYEELKAFFPENAVEYFVSYYDYYQPEAYIAKTDTYIEKDSSINEKIDRLRHSATRSLLERRDVIVVSSVSCIYGLGSPEFYMQMIIPIKVEDLIDMNELQQKLIAIHYERNDLAFKRGVFRVKGDVMTIFPSHYESRAWKISFFGDRIESIIEFDPISGKKTADLNSVTVFANSHYVTPKLSLQQAMEVIKSDLEERVNYYKIHMKILEAQRIEQRTKYDLEMLEESGTCKGIENYSRYLSGKRPGEAPPTLFEYLAKDAILFIDESHVTIPQIGAMYNGDLARKTVLVEHGFRLPSALDNRPLKFTEWDAMRPQTIYVSATPGKFELERTKGEFVEQVIRPTGLLDPPCTVRSVDTQIDNLLAEIKLVTAKGFRVLVTTLTKRMAESLCGYLREVNAKVAYLHSDISTLDRIDIIHSLRSGQIDILVGVNLLREGLDIPECGLVAILNADEEGFLRSTTSLIQTIGRAARNSEGKVILYANKMTDSIKKALSETNRRRLKQEEHNKLHNITPATIKKKISEAFYELKNTDHPVAQTLKEMEKQMLKAAEELNFELAASLRDKIRKARDQRTYT